MHDHHDNLDGDRRKQEPVRGLPEHLPPGEQLLWQGQANGKSLAFQTFHIRLLVGYFSVIVASRVAFGMLNNHTAPEIVKNAVITGALGLVCLGVLAVIAYFMAKESVFSITNRRVVIRHGIAIRKYINIPFSHIKAVALKTHGSSDIGDIAIETASERPVPYLHLWPFNRPFQVSRPVPLLRCVDDVEVVSSLLTAAIKDNSPEQVSLHRPQRASDTGSRGSFAQPEATAS